jgi:tripartite ATP-independent transporter DctP family solute receptor
MLVNTAHLSWLSGLILCIVFGLSPVTAAAEHTYQLAHMFARGSLSDQAANKFAERVAAQSKGAVQILITPEGMLGDERENVAQLRKGVLNFSVTGDIIISNIGDHYRVINMPFIYRDAQHALQAYESSLGNTIRNNLKNEGIEALSWHYVGTRMLTAQKPIRNANDLKGLRLRLPQDSASITTWQALGADIKQVQFTELATALKQGRVDAQENPPNFIRANQLYLHQKYLIDTNHMPQRQMFLAGAAFWNKLPADQRALLRHAAAEASRWATAEAAAAQRRDLTWLINNGNMTFIQFDRKGIREIVDNTAKSLAGKEGFLILDKIRALR